MWSKIWNKSFVKTHDKCNKKRNVLRNITNIHNFPWNMNNFKQQIILFHLILGIGLSTK